MSRARPITPAGDPKAGRLHRRALTAALAVVALVAGAAMAAQAPAYAVTGQVRGNVFFDFDGDGSYDTGNTATSGIANDVQYAGVVVRAYSKSNALVGTATTTATGNPNFILALTGVADGDPLRLEYTLPAGSFDSFIGTNSGTSVRFTTAGAENVDLGVVRPDDFNSNNPYVTTVLQRPGIPTSTANTNVPAVVMTRWDVAANAITAQTESPNCSTGSNCATFTARKTVATLGQVGAVYSAAYDAQGRDIYVAATYKRGAGLGGLGIGGIYRINDVVDATGTAVAGTPTVTNWVDVTAAAGLNIGVGTALSNAARNLTATDGIFADPDGFAKAGKIGIGGMVIDSDRRILYFVNLNDKRIYAISLAATPTLIGSWATPAGANQRAFALSLRNGYLYVGYSDTGEAYPFCPASSPGTTYTGTTCTGNTANPMRAYVARATLAATGAPGTFTTVLTAPLGYAKGNNIYDWQGNGATVANANPQTLRWNSWTDNWSGSGTSAGRSVAFQTTGGWGTNWLQAYPQPYVASLSFDASGFLTLGLGDRTQTQSGNRQVAANNTAPTGSSTTFETISAGDILLAAPNTDGTFSLENNGTATGTAGTRTAAAGRDTQPTNAEGPGGYEFYYDRGALGAQTNHREGSMGATVIAPGVTQVASTFVDPLGPVRVNGLGWFDATNGNMVRGYQQENDPGGASPSSSFQKGGGIGSLALVLRDAPVEIGNRVWYDADLDGLQDADEPAIGGAIVELWADTDGDGAPDGATPLATATTTSGSAQGTTVYGATTHTYTGTAPGTYYFRSEDAPTGGVTGFTKQGTYVLVFRKPTNTATAVSLSWPTATVPAGFTGLTWAQIQLTTRAATGTSILNDSNPNPANGRAPVTVGGGSENDHTLDAGWYGLSSYRIQKSVVAGTAATGQTFTINVASASNFRGDNTLGTGGVATDPIVDTLSYSVTAGQTVTTTERVPYGTVLTFTEANAPSASVAFSPFVAGNDDIGRIVVTPATAGSETLVTASNSLTSIVVTKALSPTTTLPAGTTFPIEYTVGTGATQTAEVAVGSPLTLSGIPWGATVKIREPLTGPFTWGGLIWTTGDWTQGATALTRDASGWVTVTAPTSTTALALTLTNHPYLPPALPFAGGLGADAFTIGGGLVLVLALGLAVVAFRARRSRRRALHRA